MKNSEFILLLMIFLHVVDDFVLQAHCLNNLKQKSWWRAQDNYNENYKDDYLMGLLMHAFSWTFLVMLPIAFSLNFQLTNLFIVLFLINWIVHFIVDDLKANRGKLNLLFDQSIHIFQIIVTLAIMRGTL